MRHKKNTNQKGFCDIIFSRIFLHLFNYEGWGDDLEGSFVSFGEEGIWIDFSIQNVEAAPIIPLVDLSP